VFTRDAMWKYHHLGHLEMSFVGHSQTVECHALKGLVGTG